MTPLVDLLIVNYNTRDMLGNLLVNLNLNFDPVVNIVVQDNGSTDGSIEWLDEHASEFNVTHKIISPNVGYAKAINRMAALTASPILAAVNADTQFTTRHVRQMITTFEDNPRQAICGPKQVDFAHRIRHGGITWDGVNNPQHRGWNQFDPRDQLFKDRVQCWTVSGSLYYIRRDVWNDLTNDPVYQEISGGADGAFLPTPHYFEETFCSVYAQHKGYEVWYDGTIETAYHAWHASSPVGGAPERDYFSISRGMYIKACDAMGITHECK